MWPKMLIELLPHLSRLVPMWDRFLSQKAANDKATEQALASMTSMSEGVREDMGKVSAAHSALYRQLQDQSTQIAALTQEMTLARDAALRAETAARHHDPELAALTLSVKRLGGILIAVIVLLVVVIGLQIARFLR